MKDNSQQFVTLGSVGGMGGSATPGGYNQGNMIAGVRATGDSSPRMAGKISAGGDVRVGGHFGPTTSLAAEGGYNQGDMFTATSEAGFGGTATGQLGGAKAGGDVRVTPLDAKGNPKAAPAASGYAQGDMFAGSKK